MHGRYTIYTISRWVETGVSNNSSFHFDPIWRPSPSQRAQGGKLQLESLDVFTPWMQKPHTTLHRDSSQPGCTQPSILLAWTQKSGSGTIRQMLEVGELQEFQIVHFVWTSARWTQFQNLLPSIALHWWSPGSARNGLYLVNSGSDQWLLADSLVSNIKWISPTHSVYTNLSLFHSSFSGHRLCLKIESSGVTVRQRIFHCIFGWYNDLQ